MNMNERERERRREGETEAIFVIWPCMLACTTLERRVCVYIDIIFICSSFINMLRFSLG